MENKKRITLGIVFGSLALLFIVWSILVKSGVTQAFDETIVESVINFRGEKGGFIYWVVRILTEFGYIFVMVPVLLAGVIIFRFDLKSTGLAVGTACAHIANSIIKKIILRPRPLEIFHWMEEHSMSYPSGHTLASTFMYGFMAYLVLTSDLSAKTKKILVPIIIAIIPIVGLTRIILCVHYFSDVVGAMLFGSTLITLAIFIYEELKAKNFNFLRPIIDKKLLKK